jgi:hypothetical protein
MSKIKQCEHHNSVLFFSFPKQISVNPEFAKSQQAASVTSQIALLKSFFECGPPKNVNDFVGDNSSTCNIFYLSEQSFE